MTININDFQPKLPDFEWNGKEYILDKIVFYPVTRKKHQALRDKANLETEDLEEIIAQGKEWVAFLNSLCPEMGKDGLLDPENDDVPEYARKHITKLIVSGIYNVPYDGTDEELHYSHLDAEKMLDHLIAEKAGKEHLTSDEMRVEIEVTVFEKK